MIGLGTIINTAGIAAGGVFGHFFGKLLKERHRESLTTACGISVIFIGIAGAMEGMLGIENGSLTSGRSMLIVLCLVLGILIGEIINIEKGLESFGKWLRKKTGSEGDNTFVTGFVNTSLTVCIGAMAIVGSIKDGLEGDWSILATKTILDFIIVMIMTGSMGKGCVFSAIPVFVLEGSVTLLAILIKPLMTEAAIFNLSMVGSVMIFCVGVNLVWGSKVRVANMLPAIILAVAAAFLPFEILK